MSGPLSTDDGTDDQDGAEYERGYDSLEDRIYNSKRPPSDEETQHTVRLEGWQLSQVEIITTEINTSKAEVLAKSYIHGLSEVREEISLERMKRIAEVRSGFMKFILNDGERVGESTEYMDKLHEANIELEVKMEDGSTRAVGVPIPNSVMSEVIDRYVDKMGLDGGFHRLCITVGLSDSNHAGKSTETYKAQMVDSLQSAIDEAEEMIGSTVADYVAMMSFEWSKSEADEEMIDHLCEVVDRLETEEKERAIFHLESVELEDNNEQNSDD